MPRGFTPRREPTSSLTCYISDLKLIGDVQAKGETKADALRRIFLTYFGADKVKQAQETVQKNLVRQTRNLRGFDGEHQQAVLIDPDLPVKTFKDYEYTRHEIRDIIEQEKGWTKLMAENSIIKAEARGDLEQLRNEDRYKIHLEWWKEHPIKQMERVR